MKRRGMFLFVHLLTLLFVLALAGLQTTLWFQFFGSFPAPLLWLNVITFLILYRPPFESIFTIYFLGFALCTFSAVPFSVMSSTLLVLFAITYLTKRRFFWTGSGYYWLASFLSSFVFQLAYLAASGLIEPQKAAILPLDRLAQALLTPLFAPPTYVIMNWIEGLNDSEAPETGVIGG
jgi:hypothetical protein